MEFNAKEIVRTLLKRENTTQKELAEQLTKRNNKKYTSGSLAQKIGRGTLTYDEMVIIADILGYKINIERKKTE